MNLLTIFILAIALCFDSFAVSISCGLGCGDWRLLRGVRFASIMGFMQGFMVFLGWALAATFHSSIANWDHWIAFILLFLLGGKMILGALKSIKENDGVTANNLGFVKSLILGVATSIDAIIAGISIAFASVTIVEGSQFQNIIIASVIVFGVTLIASYIGLMLGRGCRGGFGGKIGKNAEFIGGVILILIGVKVLIEHLAV